MGDGLDDAADLDAVAEELYALPREEFLAVRTARARDARAAKRRELAAQIEALRKPTTAAWLANLLARERPADVGALAGLGEALREATAGLDGPVLQQLSRQRHQLVAALVGQARALGREHGVRVGDAVVRELEQTVVAALTTPGAAGALAAGRLSTALDPADAGWPTGGPVLRAVGGTARPRRAADRPGERTAEPTDEDRAEERERQRRDEQRRDEQRREEQRRERERAERRAAARRELDAAQDALDAAETDRAAAREALEVARHRAREADDEVHRLLRELVAARAAAEEAQQRVTADATGVEDSDERVRAATRALSDVRRRVAPLLDG